jgi:hypothetical protein
VAPIAKEGLVGAGLITGYRYGILAAELTEAFFQSGYRPVDARRFQSTMRYQLELDAELQFELGPAHIFFGPGVQLNGDSTDTKEFAADGSLATTNSGRWRVRPSGVFGIATGIFLARGVIASSPHFDLGVVFGR